MLLSVLALTPAARGASPAAPRTGLQQAQRSLAALAAGTRLPTTRRELAAASAAMGRATAPTLWLDPRHVVAPLYGLSVFADSRAALVDLEHVSGGSPPSGALSGVEGRILAADRLLAEGSIRQAAGGPGGLLARASGMILSGDRWAVTSRFDLGAEQYGAGWRDAFQALTDLVVVRTTLVAAGKLSAAAENALGSRQISPAGVRFVGGRPRLSASGKPEVLFVGTLSCRFCAVERWGLVVALSQFGTFSNLHLSQSAITAPPVVRSFTFAGARYQSPYVSFAPVELSGEAPRPGGGYEPLQRLTPAQRSVFTALDAGRRVPFVDLANRVLDVGATVSPALLSGPTWSGLAASLRRARTPAGQAIAATAEVLTAEICRATGGAPATVCGAAAVQDYTSRLQRFGGDGGGCAAATSTAATSTAATSTAATSTAATSTAATSTAATSTAATSMARGAVVPARRAT